MMGVDVQNVLREMSERVGMGQIEAMAEMGRRQDGKRRPRVTMRKAMQ
jgi:hypothetical protein